MMSRPDLRNVTAVAFDHRDPKAMVKMLAAHADALNLGDLKYLNHFTGYRQFIYWENYEAFKFVNTDFALFLHPDGYVIHPELWDPEFLKYDYIGAPWPSEWLNKGTVSARVGNGGFCIKSRALMSRVAMLPWRDVPGDFLVCCQYRQQLEAEGFRFAPVDVAAHFSVEHVVRETPLRTFGFHGRVFPSRENPLPIWDSGRIAI